MTIYFLLANYTDQGIRHVRESPARLDKARQLATQFGGKIHEFYLTMGAYDMVVKTEFPDDATAATFCLELGSLGNVRTSTLKAFPENAFREIVSSMP